MIVVTTPTGDIGSKVVAKLVSRNEKVRVIVRDASKLDSSIHDAVEIVEGSQNDPDIVLKAFEGADAIFWIVPPQTDTDNVIDYYKSSNRIAADAIKERGVKHAVWVSTLGSDMGINAGHLTAALQADGVLLETGVSARILCPATFMENLLRQVTPIKEQAVFSLPVAADHVFHNVATRDIADAAVNFLINTSWEGQERVPLVGPDNLTPNKMAEIISEVLGKPIGFSETNRDAMVPRMMSRGMSHAWAQGLADMATAQNNGFYEASAAIAPRAPTNFKIWCEEVLKPIVSE